MGQPASVAPSRLPNISEPTKRVFRSRRFGVMSESEPTNGTSRVTQSDKFVKQLGKENTEGKRVAYCDAAGAFLFYF